MPELNLPDPKVECWDYAFSQTASTKLWVAYPPENPDSVVTCNTSGGWWRSIACADTQEALRSDIVAMLEEDGDGDSVPELRYEQVAIADILQSWRMLRYNGRIVCVTETSDSTPTQAAAWPGGPIAPVRNGFVYMAVHKETGEPYSRNKLGSRPMPVCCNSINHLIGTLTELIDDGGLFADYWIVAENVLSAAIQWPIVEWQGRPFPLYPVMQLNPNHNGDPEEAALSGT